MGTPVTRRGPHRLLLLFLVATILPAGALVWLGWQLVSQDAQLERQRMTDLVATAAVSAVAAADRELTGLERALPAMLEDNALDPGEPALAVRLTPSGVDAHAGAPLLFVPGNRAPALPDSTWIDAERLEFARRDIAGAIGAYRALARSPDPRISAGARIRLARVLKKAGRLDEALATYEGLAGAPSADVDGNPSDLLARWAMVELQRTRDDRTSLEAAATLAADLYQGRWPLDRTTFLTYAAELEPWVDDQDSDGLALADAVGAVWSDWRTSAGPPAPSGRRVIASRATRMLALWHDAGDDRIVFVATPAYLGTRWASLFDVPDMHVSFVDDAGHLLAGSEPGADAEATVTLTALDTGLPWTTRVAARTTPASVATSGRTRRNLIFAGLALLAILLPASGYLVGRAVRRELAVARQQADFVSAVSHEFRSPLTSLAHLASLLRRDLQPSAERRHEYYDVIAHETDRLRRFVDTLLDFGRMRSGAARYDLVPLDPVPFIHRVVDEFRRDAASRGRSVSCAAQGSMPQVAADAEALSRAVWNLLENAIKYSPDDAPVSVMVEDAQPGVAIRVADRGAGIPDAERPRLFEQFYRGEAAVKSAVRGTGVGLAMVQHIVSAHGGRVDLKSEVGAGSTFSIVLPAAAGPAASVRAS